ncbi:MAG: hypothetical protein J6W63_06155 [Treponema sp.]|nr:hypothetical protein [Treponema sp.]
MKAIIEISPAEMGMALLHHKEETIAVLEGIAEAFGNMATKFKELKTVQVKAPEPKHEPLKVHTVRLNDPAPEKKPRSEKAQKSIDAIKKAYNEKRAEKTQEKKTRVKRSDIDDAKIVKMRDEDGMKFNKIAKEIGCCEQTVINRYNKAKNGGNR